MTYFFIKSKKNNYKTVFTLQFSSVISWPTWPPPCSLRAWPPSPCRSVVSQWPDMMFSIIVIIVMIFHSHLPTEQQPWSSPRTGDGGRQVLSSDTSPLTVRAGETVGSPGLGIAGPPSWGTGGW